MKLIIFTLIIASPMIRNLIFKFKIMQYQKHIIWTTFKWSLAIIIILSFKLPFVISFSSIFFGLLLFLVSLIYFAISTLVFNFNIFKGLNEIQKLPLIYRIFGALSAGITEEIIYRGFLTLFLDEFLNNLFLSSFISLIIFGAFHVPLWGIKGSIQISIWSIILYLYFLFKGEIFALIIAHSLNDLIFFCYKFRIKS